MNPERCWSDLSTEIASLQQQHLWRELRQITARDSDYVHVEGRPLVNFASNDYLGFAQAPFLQRALMDAIAAHGAGAGASRLVSGSYLPHQQLESRIARVKGTEAALSFSSGYAVPMGVLPALVGAGDTIILDKLSHACLVDAARLSGATLRVFPHNHLEKLKRLLETAKGRVLIITEAVFSMDGDQAPLREIVALKQQFGAWLLVDEAHALGVLGPHGRGLSAAHGLEADIELQMGTLSKAVGLSGGYLAASRTVIDLLINRARSFIYSTAPPPFLAAAAGQALEHLTGAEGEQRRARLQNNHDLFTRSLGLEHQTFQSAILPILLGDESRALQLSARLRDQGFWVPAIRYPTVAKNSARLRLTLSAEHREQDLHRLAETLRPWMLEGKDLPS
jgi:8-amino-7-oxononanoate synthase